MNYLEIKKKAVLMNSIKKGRLPAEYQEVEWIKGTGAQYIDTGFTINSNSKIVFNAKFGQSNGWFFGIKTQVQASGFAGTYFKNNNSVFDFFGSRHTFIAPDDDSWHKLDYSKNGLYIDEIQTTDVSLKTEISQDDFFIFRPNTDGAVVTINPDVTFKNVEFYQNGIDLTFNYIPCYRKSDNIIGMYDLVTNTFYTNAGTGEFIKGADIN